MVLDSPRVEVVLGYRSSNLVPRCGTTPPGSQSADRVEPGGLELDLPSALPLASIFDAAHFVRQYPPSERDDARGIPRFPPELPGADNAARLPGIGERAGGACRGRPLRGGGAVVRPRRCEPRRRISPGLAPGARQGHGSAPVRRYGVDGVAGRERARARAAVPVAQRGAGARRDARAGTALVGPVRRGRRRAARPRCRIADMEKTATEPPGVAGGRRRRVAAHGRLRRHRGDRGDSPASRGIERRVLEPAVARSRGSGTGGSAGALGRDGRTGSGRVAAVSTRAQS